MRKFNFNSFRKKTEAQKPEQRFSAYRTVISRHQAVQERLKDEPLTALENH